MLEEERIEGDYRQLAVISFTDILDRHPVLQWSAIAATVTLAFLAVQTIHR